MRMSSRLVIHLQRCTGRLPVLAIKLDLDLTGFTHLNFTFAFFHPTTFEMTDMDVNAGRLYNRFTELKATKPSLKTWISVGGWSFTVRETAATADTHRVSCGGRPWRTA